MSSERRMRKVYRLVPEIGCKGLCHEACGPILMSHFEFRYLQSKYGSVPAGDRNGTCTKLSADKRCTIYKDRPLVCRMFGAVEGLPCPHGCKPSDGVMTDQRARELLMVMERLK